MWLETEMFVQGTRGLVHLNDVHLSVYTFPVPRWRSALACSSRRFNPSESQRVWLAEHLSLITVSRRQAVTVDVMKTSSQARTMTAVRACRTPPLSHSSPLIDSSTLLEALLTHTEYLNSAQRFSTQSFVTRDSASAAGHSTCSIESPTRAKTIDISTGGCLSAIDTLRSM